MPLIDHFRPPLSPALAWESFHTLWTAAMVMNLNRTVLPQDYCAAASVHFNSRIEVDVATTVHAYRAVSAELKAPISKISLIIADQQATNKMVAEYVAKAAAADHGDPTVAKAGANAALAQVQADLQTARIFQMDVSIVDLHVQKLAARLNTVTTTTDLEQVNGGLQVRARGPPGAAFERGEQCVDHPGHRRLAVRARDVDRREAELRRAE